MTEDLNKISLSYLDRLCNVIKERPVGSVGNREAADFIEKEMAMLGWETETPEFEALDWHEGGAVLRVGSEKFVVSASPYSLGYSCDLQIELVAFNGEDYYSVPGQMNYIAASQDSFNQIMLNINNQTITHTPEDRPEIVDCHKLDELAETLNTFIRKL